ncbi:RDD family protein [Fulvivirga sedimenti]|uniref:RDD family protein n=1 Tax=Fulvivirga sedimenti TaxID=2879465 RepID=A0A9X1KXN2_9BACT|nr:RDD family protein [Fulvivirga sedimenti]MCA6074357.1 RDD family protein [Fulvivirga sedimenti]
MQTIQIQTTQNVGIQYAVAGLGERIGAYLLDSVIIGAYVIIVMFLLTSVGINTYWIFILFYLPAFFYHLISEALMDGQSIGKKQFGLKVVRLDGNPVTLGNYVMRWILRLVDISITSGAVALLSIAVTKEGQRIGDIAAGTTVVRLREQRPVQSHQVIEQIDSDYVPQFKSAASLRAEDIELIRQALSTYKSTGNVQPILAITEKVKEHLQIESDMPPVTFLYTILKDYSYLNSQ